MCLQFKFAVVIMGRHTYLPEDDEYNININDFTPHHVQGTAYSKLFILAALDLGMRC